MSGPVRTARDFRCGSLLGESMVRLSCAFGDAKGKAHAEDPAQGLD